MAAPPTTGDESELVCVILLTHSMVDELESRMMKTSQVITGNKSHSLAKKNLRFSMT